MTSDIAVSAHLQASDRLAHFRAFCCLTSQLQLADPQQILQVMLLTEPCMIMLPQISSELRNQDKYNMCCDKGETHQKAPNVSFTCGTWGTARQKPDRVILRHFCN